MNKKVKIMWIMSALSALLFIGLILAVKLIDVGAIGPMGSEIGLASVNGAVKDAVGISEFWYELTELIGIGSIAVAGAFALLGVYQLLSRKSLKRVDKIIYLMGGMYVAVAILYVAFEILVINQRPVLVDGELEASFPSSHTVLVLCIMFTAIHFSVCRIKQKALRIVGASAASLLALITVVGRMLSGVHWFTDILGGFILSLALAFAYLGVWFSLNKKKEERAQC